MIGLTGQLGARVAVANSRTIAWPEAARGAVEHRTEVAAQIAKKTIRSRRRDATQSGLDVRARELRGGTEHDCEGADQASGRIAEKCDEHHREQHQVPAVEDRLQQVEHLGQRHLALPFSCSASLSVVVAAQGRNTGGRAPRDLNVASQSFCPLP